MERIKAFYRKHKEIILYLLFGAVTTVASLTACYATLKLGVFFIHDENGEPTKLLDVLASTVQWIAGVTVAFITNKKWVFTNADKGFSPTLRQLLKFSGGRLITYFLEVGVNLGAISVFEAVDYTPVEFFGFSLTSRLWAKLISSVVIVITNYFISKLVVFKKRNTENQ